MREQDKERLEKGWDRQKKEGKETERKRDKRERERRRMEQNVGENKLDAFEKVV